MSVVGELNAALCDYGVEGVYVADVLVDDWFVDDLPQVFGRLKLWRVGRQAEKACSFGNFEIALAIPTGVVESKDDDAFAAGAGLLGEHRQQGFEERFRNAVGNVAEAFAGGGRDEGRYIEPFEAMMPEGDGTHAHRRPDAAHDRFQPNPVLIRRESLAGEAGMG